MDKLVPGTRVSIKPISSPLSKKTGVIVDESNAPILPKKILNYYLAFDPKRVYILLDDTSLIRKEWAYYPYIAVLRDTALMTLETIGQNTVPINRMSTNQLQPVGRFEEEKEDFLSAIKNYQSYNTCGSCGGQGEYINGATKCKNCWLIW